ncbi:MAG: hypothetical protein QF752_09055 [Planctomycetota bacterium]|nr:hypothetical protein [Planctomycetota bacterium]
MNRFYVSVAILVVAGIVVVGWMEVEDRQRTGNPQPVSDRPENLVSASSDLVSESDTENPSGKISSSGKMRGQVREHLAGVLRGWSGDDDELLGRSIDEILALGWPASDALRALARSADTFEGRVFALELALRLRRDALVQGKDPQELSFIDQETEELVRNWLVAEEEALLQMVGGEEGDVLLAAWVRKVRRRMEAEALLADLDQAIADLEGENVRLSWQAAVRMTQALDSLTQPDEYKRLAIPLGQTLRRQLQEGAPGREAGLLSMLSRADPEAARRIARERLQEPGSTTPASLELSVRLLSESSDATVRNLLQASLGHESEDVRLAVAGVWVAQGVESARVTRSLLQNLSPAASSRIRSGSRQRSLGLLAQLSGFRLVPPADVERSTAWSVKSTGVGPLQGALKQDVRMTVEYLADHDSSPVIQLMARALLNSIDGEAESGN